MTESASPAYAKGPRPQPYPAETGDPTSLRLRVTLGDMPLSDAFDVVVPEVDSAASVADLLDRVFGPEGIRDEEVANLLDTRRNPDLPEMYAELLDTFADWRDGRCSLLMYRNHGPEIEPDYELASHRDADPDAPEPLLDIVIEQWHTPLEYAADRWHGGDVAALVQRLQDHVMLHYVGRLGDDIFDAESPPDAGLLAIADRLAEQGALSDDGSYTLTENGEGRLELADAEVDSAIATYDVFADVARRGGRVELGGGAGGDLRVDVYEAEGIDAAEAVLLRQLHDGTLDDLEVDWREAILDDDFFAELLIDIVDRERVDPAVLDEIIEAGFAHIEEAREQAEHEARRRHIDAQARNCPNSEPAVEAGHVRGSDPSCSLSPGGRELEGGGAHRVA